MDWVRIAVNISADDEDDVTLALREAAPGGGAEILDRRAALLVPEAGKLRPGRILVRYYVTPDECEAAWLVAQSLVGAVVSPPEPVSDEWKENWKKFFKPSRVSARFVVRPPWEAHAEPAATDIEVVIEPGMAFGTGTHETTRLCLAQVDAHVRAGHTVLDVGCGSGVLSVAAALLGAGPIMAVDVEEDSRVATVENAERNGVAHAITASLTLLEDIEGTFDVVLANILATVLVELSAQVATRVSPGGTLILSGILESDADTVVGAYEERGMQLLERTQERDWVALRFKAPSA